MKGALGLVFGLLLFPSCSWATSCNYYYNSSLPVPSGYGASYDVFVPGFPQFVAADCNTIPSVPTTIGTGATNEAVYGLAYVSAFNSSGTTNAITSAGSATLHFSSVPSDVSAGQIVVDNTSAGVVPASTTVVSSTSTTVLMSNNATGAGVGSGDAISFWTPVTLTGNVITPNGYYQGQATGDLGISSADLSSGWNFVAFLVAVYRNGSWVYGCPNVACSSPGWNLQALTTAVAMPTINTVSLSTLTLNIPAAPASLVATISVTLSSGSFAGTVVLDNSTGVCSGSASADNGKFTITGSSPSFSLNVGGSTINDTTDHVCILTTDSATANSPVPTAFVLTSSPPPPPVPVSVSLAPASLTLNDNDPSGTLVSTVTVHMSDGSTNYHGTLTSNNPLFAIMGMQVVLPRNLNPSDDGSYSVVITAP